MPPGPHGSKEHPWGQEHWEVDPTGDAPVGKEGDEAELCWGGSRGSPLHAAAGAKGGLGAGAGRAPSAWQPALAATQGMLHAGGGGLSPHNRRVAHGPMMGVQDSASHPLQSGSGRGVQRESRTGGGAGAQGGKVGQPGCCWGHGVGAWGTQHLIETKCQWWGVCVPRQGREALGWQRALLTAS